MKQDLRAFSSTANCYAFAVKCVNPVGGGTARPGGATSNGDVAAYCAALIRGVQADGGNKVRFIAEYAAQGLLATDVPAARNDWYLIAMLVKAEGFHFVRRQRKSAFGEPFWKWKEGNGGLEERSAYELSSNDNIRITDARLPDLVKGGTLVTAHPSYVGWQRIAFFEVHKDGFTVTA
ncbi:MAG: hypothetical protein REI94_04760 [Moraxellaceae bacterium]|nr:hypothetical protein [Moraxellaceae bacterium]